MGGRSFWMLGYRVAVRMARSMANSNLSACFVHCFDAHLQTTQTIMSIEISMLQLLPSGIYIEPRMKCFFHIFTWPIESHQHFWAILQCTVSKKQKRDSRVISMIPLLVKNCLKFKNYSQEYIWNLEMCLPTNIWYIFVQCSKEHSQTN